MKYLLIGATKDGYWNSFRMALQFEDVVDCLKVLYPQFDIVFLFDHSQGHARKKEGALDAKPMSRNFGGAQPVMRDTTIKTVEGFLGSHSLIGWRCPVVDIQAPRYRLMVLGE